MLLGGALAGQPSAPPPRAPDITHGAELAALARCAACHTLNEADPYGGGYAMKTTFGTFYGTNLTPDPNAGIGTWRLEDFVRAMREGRDDEHRPLYPAFPYTSFTHLTDDDLADIYAFLRTIPRSATSSRPHELEFLYRGRWVLPTWQLLNLKQGPETVPDGMPADVARGRYLADGAGHCGECHTPRNSLGGMKRKESLAGWADVRAPDIRPAKMAEWGASAIISFLEDGIGPDGDTAGGEMRGVIRDGTAKLSAEDRAAIAAWLVYEAP